MSPSPPVFTDATSIYQEAATYKIITARISLDALTIKWTIYPNRPLIQSHVARLCSIFQAEGPLREVESNFLLVKASEKMINDFLDRYQDIQPVGKARGETIFDLRAWKEFRPENHLEVLAGQHRIEALKRYVKLRKDPDTELWWTCIIYKGKFLVER